MGPRVRGDDMITPGSTPCRSIPGGEVSDLVRPALDCGNSGVGVLIPRVSMAPMDHFDSFEAVHPSVPTGLATHQDIFCLLIRKLFPTTLMLESAIAPAAIIGLSNPSAASGMAAML
jgi:hypothetical protein